MSSAEELRKELKKLQEKRQEDQTIKQLKKQIRAEKFAQTKSGKIFNAIGSFGERITRPKPAEKGKKKKASKVISVQEVMARLPQ
jgi:hypothetical protein